MILTSPELSLCVRLIGRGWTLAEARARIAANRRQLSFQQLLAAPTTGARLDAMLTDNARIDAALELEKGRAS